MSDDTTAEHQEDPTPPGDPSSADDALDAQLAEPYMQGNAGIERAQVGVSAFLIALFGVLVFANSFGLPLTEDGAALLQGTEGLHRIADVSKAWNDSSLRPLSAISLALNWRLGDGSVLLFRLFNIFLHIANGILLYLLVRRLLMGKASEPICLLAGIFFIAHPGATHAVHAVEDRGALVATFFVLFSCVLYLRATQKEKRLATFSYGLSLIAFVGAWAAGLVAAIVPLLITLLDWNGRRSAPVKNRLTLLAPYWALFVGLLIVYNFGRVDDATAREQYLSLSGYSEALKVTFDPMLASAAHPPYVSAGNPWVTSAIIAVPALLALFIGIPGLGVAWFASGLAIPSIFGVGDSFQEGALYFPLAGIVIVFPWLVSRFTDKQVRTIAGLVVFILVGVCAVLTVLRNQDWRDETVLWVDARDKCEGCLEPSLHLGSLFLHEGEEALQQMRDAQAIGDTTNEIRHRERASAMFGRADSRLRGVVSELDLPSSEIWLMLGQAQRYQGKADEAMESLRRAMKDNPLNQQAVLEAALASESKALVTGRPEDSRRAIEYYRQAGQLGPMAPEILLRYGMLLVRVGDTEQSAVIMQRLVDRGVQEPAISALARAHESLSALRTVRDEVARIPQSEMGSADFITLRSRELFLRGNFLQAGYMIETIHRRGAELDDEQWLLLGVSKAKMNSLQQFFTDWPDGLGRGEASRLWNELARRLASSAAWDAALSTLRHNAAQSANTERPKYTLAGIAENLGDPRRAAGYLSQVAEENPTDPEPWLRLTEMAITAGQPALAARYISEAQTRNAPDETLEKLRERAGVTEQEGVRTRLVP